MKYKYNSLLYKFDILQYNSNSTIQIHLSKDYGYQYHHQNHTFISNPLSDKCQQDFNFIRSLPTTRWWQLHLLICLRHLFLARDLMHLLGNDFNLSGARLRHSTPNSLSNELISLEKIAWSVRIQSLSTGSSSVTINLSLGPSLRMVW